jgi:4-diphosphocytidyl-2-C-methyl-D-erythritol kinase
VSGTTAPAKINLALVVGPRRPDGKHEVATLLQRISLADSISLDPAERLEVRGFDADTLVAGALTELADALGVEPEWCVTLEKRIPVAAGLGGGSSDAAAALRLANETAGQPLPAGRLSRLAARIGADVPFFLEPGPQLATGDGTELQAAALPADYHVLVLMPDGARKESTAAVYDAFDRRAGDTGFEARRRALLEVLEGVRTPRDLAGLPRNDLVSSPLAVELERAGAFRADVSGAGPAVYGLFEDEASARLAAEAARPLGKAWICRPTW